MIETPAAQALLFSVEVTKHDSRQIVMEMNFAKPDLVSTGNQQDMLNMEVTEPSLFLSKDLKTCPCGAGPQDRIKSVPPMISDPI